MIRKILSLNGIGRFEEFKAHGDVEFKKFTLIFGDNGVGKTTLCDVIRSLQTGAADIIEGRKTLGMDIEPAAKLLLSDGLLAEFKNGAWTRTSPGGLSIFDANYVRENVHAGEVVDTVHKRNLFQVIVGSEGVRLANLVESLEKQRSDLNPPSRDAKRWIDAALPADMTIEQFLAFPEDPDIDAKIGHAEIDLAAAKKSDEIRQRKGLQPLVVPALPTDFLTCLDTTLEGIGEQSEMMLKEHAVHLGTTGAQTWLAAGTAMVTDETCPFCKQNIQGNDLIAAYRACFSEAYRTLADRVGQLEGVLQSLFGDAPKSRLEMLLATNIEALHWWKKYAAVADLPEPNVESITATMDGMLKHAVELVKRKRSNLLESVEPGREFTDASERLGCVLQLITAYNEAVETGTEAIEARKAELVNVDISAADRKLKRRQAIKKRHEEPLAEQCEIYQRLRSKRDDLGTQKERAKATLDQYLKEVVGTYEKALNAYLRKFMVGFKIQGTKAEFPRGLPSSSYRLVINDIEIDLGSEQSPSSEPTFKNTLSGGDRSALALALFMAQLDHDPKKSEITVILDDPFQSQDAFRRNATAFQIKRVGESVEQVIVMSHDPHFLKLVWDELPTNQRKALRLNAVGTTSTISEWDIYEHLKSDHQHNIAAMQRYIDDGKGDPRDVAQKLRPALEGYCKIVAYGEFGEKDMMGDIIKGVRETGPDHVLHHVLDQLEEFNSYARRYHHATNPDAAIEPLNEGELKGYTRHILELMRKRTTT